MAGNGRQGADLLLLEQLAGGVKLQAAAQKAGISERTAFRRMQDPAFRQQLDGLRAEALERAAGALSAMATQAVTTLYNLLSANSEYVRLGAARAILEMAMRAREMTALEQRIKQLEESLTREGQDGDSQQGEKARKTNGGRGRSA